MNRTIAARCRASGPSRRRREGGCPKANGLAGQFHSFPAALRERAIAASPVGSWPCRCMRPHPPGVGPHVVAEPKFLLPVVVLPELLLGEDCHGQADQRVAAADLHGRVHRERHICRNPAPLGRRPNLVRAGASFVAIAFAVLAARPFRGPSPEAGRA